MAASYRFVVSGRVQGVGFRHYAVREAMALGVAGWLRNRDDGCVEGVACGEAAGLEAFRRWLGHGPPAARVARVDWEATAEASTPDGFRVRD